MGKNPWEESDHEVLAQEAGLQANRSKRWLRVIIGILVVATLTFIGAYYVPLFRAHAVLRDEYRQLSERRRVLDETLENKQRELEKIGKEKAELQAKLDERASEEEQQQASLEKLRGQVSSAIRAYETKGLASTSVEAGRVRVALANDLVFSRHTVTIPTKGTQLLCSVVKASKDADLRVVAITTSDERPAALLAAKYPSRSELSAARAALVGKRLEDKCNVSGVEAASRVEASQRSGSKLKPPIIVLELAPAEA